MNSAAVAAAVHPSTQGHPWLAAWGWPLASAGLLGAFSWLEPALAPVGLVALVPWLLAVDRAPSTRAALGRTWLVTCGFVALGFPWLVHAAEVYTGLWPALGWPLLLALAPVLQPQLLVAAWVRRALGPGSLGGRLGGVAAWLATEALVPKLLADTLGAGLHPLALLRPLAGVGTVALLTALVLLVNEGLAWVVARRPRWRWAAVGGALALAEGLVFAPGLRSPDSGVPVSVAAVQASLPRYDALLAASGSEGLMTAVLEGHDALTRQAVGQGADLVAWGETVYPTTFGQPKSEGGRQFDERVQRLVQALGRPLLLGTYEREGGTEFNVAALVDEQGGVVGRSRKSRLFPVGETLPWGALWVRLGLWEGPTGWGQGQRPAVLTAALPGGRRVRVEPLICYEAVFAELVDPAAQLLVTLSNDGGFGSALEARQALVSSAWRSAESGLPQLRVANSGTSALIDGTGAVLDSLGPGQRGVLVGTLRVGDGGRRPAAWVAPGLTSLALALALARRRLQPKV